MLLQNILIRIDIKTFKYQMNIKTLEWKNTPSLNLAKSRTQINKWADLNVLYGLDDRSMSNQHNLLS